MIVAFLRLSRLKFLVGGFLGFGLGAAIASYEGAALTPGRYALGQALVTAFHLMTHYSNDYFDRASDARTTRTAFSGGSGALVDGSLPPIVALVAALVCLAVGLALTVAFALRGEWTMAVLGLAIAIFAWSYSSPPLRLLATGAGEAITSIVVAVLVPLAGYATFLDRVDVLAVVSTLPLAAAMIAMMLCVEFPDVEADAATGKRNLVVRLGRAGSVRLIYGAIVAVAVGSGIAVALGAPTRLAVVAAVVVIGGGALWRTLAIGRYTTPRENAAIAFRGVALYISTALAALLAYVSMALA
jgi:1,4-dihydroxy-2-naphthoate octaprenyltransferase